MRELSFSEGAAVEVSIDEESSRDIWFPATVVKGIGNGSFLVEYHGSNEAGFVKAVVDSLHIRPPPPSYSNRDFHLLEKVDAFYGFGWSSGIVTKVLADGRYIVFFKRTRKEKELSHTDLRLHMEWMDCKWVNPSQGILITSNSQEHLGCSNASGDNVNIAVAPESSGLGEENDKEEKASYPAFMSGQQQLVGGSEKSPADIMTTGNRRIKQMGRNNATKGTPTKKANGDAAPDASLLPEACRLKTVETVSLNSERATYSLTPTAAQNGTASLEKSEDINQLLAKSLTCGRKKVEAEGKKYNFPDNEKYEVTRKRGRPPRPVVKTPQAVVADGAAASIKVDSGGIEERPKIRPVKEVIIGLSCYREGKTSKGESPRQLPKMGSLKVMQDGKSQADVKANHEIAWSKLQKDGESSTPKRKRGRPPKLQGSSPKAKGPGKEQNSAGADADQNDGRHSTANEALLPIVKAIEPAWVSGSVPSESHRQKLVNLIGEQTKQWSVGRRQTTRHAARRWGKKSGKILNETFRTAVVEQAKQQRRKITVEIESLNLDLQDALGVNATLIPANIVVQDAEPSVARISSNTSDDDRPLSTWFEGVQSSPKKDDAIPPGGTVSEYDEVKENQDKVETSASNQCKEANAKQDEPTTQNVNQDEEGAGGRADKMVIDCDATVPSDWNLTDLSQNLPFSKSSLIWKMIESMEVFQVMPQRPHFRPLYECKEECREGLAIGNMVTFASLVDKVTKFQFDHPKSILDSNMEILADLEKQGFDVEAIRGRLGALLSIKGRHEHAENSVKDLRNQIVDQTREKSRIKEEIKDIDKKILELNGRRRMAVALEERADTELAELQSSADAIKEFMASSRAEFERIAAAAW